MSEVSDVVLHWTCLNNKKVSDDLLICLKCLKVSDTCLMAFLGSSLCLM